MIKRRWLILFLLLYLLSGSLFLHSLTEKLTETPVNMVAVNRIVHDTAQDWNRQNFQKASDCPYDYAVLDARGTLLYQSADTVPVTVHDAVSGHQAVMDVETDGQLLGKVLILTGYERLMEESRRNLTIAFLVFFVFLLLPAILYLVYLYRYILRPFLSLKDFARHVAVGELDFPLPMDRGHIFGAFTESFDMMRDQLKEARLRADQADKSKKELIASLSHDIKTPVASIKLVSELLLATEPEGKTKDKIGTIYEKAEQIDHLVTNLFQASLNDLGKMTVNLSEESSQILEPIIRSADYYEKAELSPIPGCILLTDPLRLSQVIDNVIHNSYKYADTAILVTSALTEDGLTLHFQDYGKGVPDEELPYLFQKFYRGSIHADGKTDGSGLGLYISRLLMEQMGGSIRCGNLKDGFFIELCIPLAGINPYTSNRKELTNDI